MIRVVSYRNSTSNHNGIIRGGMSRAVVSYRNSTSNHNFLFNDFCAIALYLIEILHQTTTRGWLTLWIGRCILSKFYIKPQPGAVLCFVGRCCILSKFYIKPQQCAIDCIVRRSCILSKFYIKPQQAAVFPIW